MTRQEKAIKKLEELRNYANNTIHPIVSPDNWEVYSKFCDIIDEIEIETITLLKAQKPETSNALKDDDNIGCWYDITHKYTLEQIINALKASDPRVMTLEEALEAEYVYLDVRLHTSLQCECCILIKDEDGDIVPLKKGFWGSLECDDYGIDWRCWTSRPDKSTREATPWET